jgi:ATP-dependent Clp protease protease subunit
MLMQVSRDRTFGQASDIELETAHLLDVKNKINAILAEICGIDAEKVNVDTERKYWLFANEAMEYGLIDRVI